MFPHDIHGGWTDERPPCPTLVGGYSVLRTHQSLGRQHERHQPNVGSAPSGTSLFCVVVIAVCIIENQAF